MAFQGSTHTSNSVSMGQRAPFPTLSINGSVTNAISESAFALIPWAGFMRLAHVRTINGVLLAPVSLE